MEIDISGKAFVGGGATRASKSWQTFLTSKFISYYILYTRVHKKKTRKTKKKLTQCTITSYLKA